MLVYVHKCVGNQRTHWVFSQALLTFSGDWVFFWCGACSLTRLTGQWAYPLPSLLRLQVRATTPDLLLILPLCGFSKFSSCPHLERQALYQENLHLPNQAWDFVFLLTRDCCGALACLELVIWIRLALNFYQSFCLCHPGASIKGIHHHTQPSPMIFHSLFSFFLNLKKLCLFCDDQNFKNSPKYY